jgi:hypothetical protein
LLWKTQGEVSEGPRSAAEQAVAGVWEHISEWAQGWVQGAKPPGKMENFELKIQNPYFNHVI